MQAAGLIGCQSVAAAWVSVVDWRRLRQSGVDRFGETDGSDVACFQNTRRIGISVVPGVRRHMRNSWIGFRVVVTIAALAVVWLTSPQPFRGHITGILTDESKGVVASANLALTNVGFACRATQGSAHEEEL